MLDAALSYAKRGWRVFPLFGPLDPVPKDATPGKSPRTTHGVKDATTDEAKIQRWWGMWPTSNIGLATGAEFVVLDIDGPHAEQQLEASGYEVPESLEVRTGKGRHIYLKGDSTIRNRAKLIGGQPGVDVRGEGGYVVAPPSVHVNGKVYEFSDPDVPLLEVPAWLRALHNERPSATVEASSDDPIPEGSRDDTLFRIACSYRARGLKYDEILTLLRGVNASRCRPPLDDKQVVAKAKQAAKYSVDEMELGGWDLYDLKARGADEATIAVAARANAAVKAALPDNAGEGVKLSLRRKWSRDSSREVEFVATIEVAGQKCSVGKLRGRDVLTYGVMVAHCFEQGMVLPKLTKGQWRELAVAALSERQDEEVTAEETVIGACVVAITDWVDGLLDTMNWRDFPTGNSTHRYAHPDGSYSVSAKMLRDFVTRAIRDARRSDINEALRRMNAVRHVAPSGNPVLLKIRVDNQQSVGYGDALDNRVPAQQRP